MKTFNQLKERYGSTCAWVEGNRYVFTLGENVMSDRGDELMGELEEKFEGKYKLCIAMGDDYPHAIEVNKSIFEEKVVQTFIKEFIGTSCYDDDGEDLDDEEDEG